MPSANLAERTLAIVVHYGDPALTARSLRSIARGSVRPGLLVVVDNGPQRVSPEVLAALDLPHRVIRSDRNIGFGAAVNLAFADAPGFALVWLLNNDAEAAPTAFAELLRTAKTLEGPGPISSLIKDSDGKEIWFQRARFYPWRLESKHVKASQPLSDDAIDPGRPSVFGIPYLPGCSLLVPAELGGPGGLLDPSFFVYGEDIELAIRASDRGWPLTVSRRSIVQHRPSSAASSRDRERLLAESAVRIVRRQFPLLLPLSIGIGTALGVVRAVKERQLYRVRARLVGYRDGLRVTSGATRPRFRGVSMGGRGRRQSTHRLKLPSFASPPIRIDVRPDRSAIAAVIVTHHPESGLGNRIRHLSTQVDAVVIVDNASTAAEVEEVIGPLRNTAAEIRLNPVNLGHASALNQGVARAALRGYAWALTLDQDTTPGPNLVSEAGRVFDEFRSHSIAAIGARYGAEQIEPPTRLTSGRHTPAVITAGALYSTHVWQALHGFRDDFFIDSVDTEYSLRARSIGYAVLITEVPTMLHAIGQPSRHRIATLSFWTSNHDRSRRYYAMRNRLFTWRLYARREPKYVMYEMREMAKDLIKLVLVENDRRGKLAAVARGAFDGLRGRGGKRPT